MLSAAEVGPGKFYFDYDAATIYIGDDPAGHKVECSVLPIAIRGTGKRIDPTLLEQLVHPIEAPAKAPSLRD